MNNIFNPNAAVIIYNYIDRQGDYSLSKKSRDKVEELILESDIISIQTQKSKSQPSGSFNIVLAPTKNWVTTLTPGSWLSIHISPKKLEKESNEGGLLSFDSKTLKMIGRIDSVHMSVEVDQDSGARNTYFTVSGRDWGQIFESSIYIDPMASLSGEHGLEQAVRYKFDEFLLKKGQNPFTTTNLIRFFIDIWGVQADAQFKKNIQKNSEGLIEADRIMPESAFYLPKEIHERCFLDGIAKGENRLANNIKLISGRLNKYNSYQPTEETGGVPNVGALIGGNTLWQVLNAHCGSVVNEMLTDFTWSDNRLIFSLYKRVRPFLLDEEASTPNGKNISSSFFYIKKTEINTDKVLSIQAGTNWRDKINFLEVLPQVGHVIPGYEWVTPMNKAKNCSEADYVSFGRDGFKPMLYSTSFLPFIKGKPQIEGIYEWLPVIKKWYFNNHKMLNGSVVISNQEDYISVGENIVLDGSLFSSSFHVKGDDTKGKDIKLLAHVESVTNTFSVNNYGARSFATAVSFVRGVFTDENVKELFDPKSYGIDSDASSINEQDEKITNVYEVKND